jgi:PAS domain S-box-containing protein
MKKSFLIDNTILFSTFLIFVISCKMLSMGITFVFPHLFYIPILISAYYYPKMGIYAAAGISLFYVIPVIFFFSGDIIVIFSALIRMLMFIVIAALVSYLVEKSHWDQEEKEHLLEFQNKIIENPRVMVTVSDCEDRVIIWNKGAENISGYLKSEVLGRSDIWNRVLSDDEETKKLRSRIRDLISSPGSIDWVPLTLVRKDEEVRYVVVSLQTMNSKPGEAPNILGIAVDITENRRLEAENRTALNQIENNVSKMYILNDQIRNPLAIILGQIEINQSSSRQIICEQVIHINDIISQLDRDSIESTKIIDYLRKHYGFFNEEQEF